jgi:RNA polymerase sigma-70 factor (ECF subfamily)
MSTGSSFAELIRQVRAGDAAAAAELVRTYEGAIRRAARVQLEDSRLRRLLDSADICQSVLASFFLRAALGQFDVDKPQQLLKLLVTMTHNKVIDQARKHAAERHHHRHQALEPGDQQVADPASSPSQHLAHQELLQQFLARFDDEERYLAQQRALGREWADIAAEHGGSPEALRKQLARAVERVAQALQVEV